jgi:hypothetical protein
MPGLLKNFFIAFFLKKLISFCFIAKILYIYIIPSDIKNPNQELQNSG